MLSKNKPKELNTDNQREILQEHFNLIFDILAESKLVPNSEFAIVDDIQRCLSGISFPFLNAVMGYPENPTNWDSCIDKQISYFKKAEKPFVWYVDEDGDEDFKQKLLKNHFTDVGIFRGVIGELKQPIPNPKISPDITLEQVTDEQGMKEFNDLVCSTFSFQGEAIEQYRKISWIAAKKNNPRMYHWIARKSGKAVAAVSTLIKDDMVSFWNGATHPDLRKKGLSTALRCLALQDAVSKGCRLGASYLMAEGLAYGICSKLGFETKWRFNAFVAPTL